MKGVAWKQIWVGVDQIQSNLNSWYCSNTGKASTKTEHQTHMKGSPSTICKNNNFALKVASYPGSSPGYEATFKIKGSLHHCGCVLARS